MSSIPNPLALRDARENEYDAIRDLTLLAYEQYAAEMGPAMWPMLRQGIIDAVETSLPAERIVAELDGTLVGSVMLFPAAIRAYQGIATEAAVPEIRVLAVNPAARAHGVGRALVEECIRRARRTGTTALGLHTSDIMQTAKALYERMGFERYPAEDFRPSGDVLVMAYRLNL